MTGVKVRETGESKSISARRNVGTIGLGLQTCRAHAETSNPRLAGRQQLYITEACFSGTRQLLQTRSQEVKSHQSVWASEVKSLCHPAFSPSHSKDRATEAEKVKGLAQSQSESVAEP